MVLQTVVSPWGTVLKISLIKRVSLIFQKSQFFKLPGLFLLKIAQCDSAEPFFARRYPPYTAESLDFYTTIAVKVPIPAEWLSLYWRRNMRRICIIELVNRLTDREMSTVISPCSSSTNNLEKKLNMSWIEPDWHDNNHGNTDLRSGRCICRLGAGMVQYLSCHLAHGNRRT